MHGLNTVQTCDYIPSRTQNNDSSQTQRAITQVVPCDNPQKLVVMSNGMFNAVDDTQAYMKRLYTTLILSNGSLFPNMLEVYWLECRDDIDSADSLEALMTADGVASDLPYISPTTGQNFLRKFKILKTKKIILRPTQTRTFTIRARMRTRPMTYIADCNPVRYLYREGTRLLFYRVYGTPVQYVKSAGWDNAVCLSPVWSHGIVKTYWSYYRMDDADPNTITTSTLATTLPAQDNRGTLPVTVQTTVPSTTSVTAVDFNNPTYVYNVPTSGIPI